MARRPARDVVTRTRLPIIRLTRLASSRASPVPPSISRFLTIVATPADALAAPVEHHDVDGGIARQRRHRRLAGLFRNQVAERQSLRPRGFQNLARGVGAFGPGDGAGVGAEGAQHFILLAKTSDDRRKGLTAFLFDADQPGWHIKRRIPIMGPEEHGGHCELIFDGLEIADENRLLGVGDGLKVTQIRLGTARLTHCMRWLGLAKRALEIASGYVAERKSFGITLAEHEGVQWMIGEAAKDIQIGRLLVMHAAWKLDQGDYARKEVSIAKIQVADTLHTAVDTAIQLCGARGYSKDTLLEWIYRYARQARLVDGASEVHKMVLSRYLMNEGSEFWSWN